VCRFLKRHADLMAAITWAGLYDMESNSRQKIGDLNSGHHLLQLGNLSHSICLP
jgi:hypothetical protein